MIRCIVLDDEPIILRSLKVKIETLNPDFQVIATAMDGQQGLELILKEKPDCVFTDISMPVMGGLQLIEEARKQKDPPVFVILSGYSEFEYARKAIKMDVVDYLVKPISNENLGNLMERIAERIHEARHQRTAEFLNRALHGISGAEDEAFWRARQAHSPCGMLLAKICIGPYFSQRFSHIRLEGRACGAPDLETICEHCRQGAEEYHCFYDNYTNERTLAFFTERDPARFSEVLFSAIRRRLGEHLNITCICVGAVQPPRQLPAAMQLLNNALRDAVIFGESNLAQASLYQEQRTCCSEEVEGVLETEMPLLRESKAAMVDSAVRKVLLTCKRNHCSQSQLADVVRRMLAVKLEKETSNIALLADILVCSSDSYEDLKHAFGETVKNRDMMEELTARQEGDPRAIIHQVSQYIEENYAKRILVQDIAGVFGFNASYLCTLFRKHRGVSPNEYIIERRIAKARELLTIHAELSVKQIGELVGYDDPYYFSRVFRLATGASPTEYRRRSPQSPNVR